MANDINDGVPHRCLTAALVEDLDFQNVIYMEVSAPGAMGNMGGVVMEVLDGNDLFRYETNIGIDEVAWNAAWEKVNTNRHLFDYHYGGVGNDVYLRKDAGLVMDEQDERIIFEHRGRTFIFGSSVLGVFRSVAASMKRAALKE